MRHVWDDLQNLAAVAVAVFITCTIWITALVSLGFHVWFCIENERWAFLIIGLGVTPIGMIHGFILLIDRMFG